MDLCKPLYKERGNVFSGSLDDVIERIHKEGGGDTEGSKRDDNGGDDNAGEGEEREGATFLEDASDDNKIYGTIDSRGTTNNNNKSAKDDDNGEGRMVGILQLWVCAMGHMEAVAELITGGTYTVSNILTALLVETLRTVTDSNNVSLLISRPTNTLRMNYRSRDMRYIIYCWTMNPPSKT